MMREILFRGKQEHKNKEWVFGNLHSEYVETDKNGQRKIDYRILGMRGECDYVIPETVGQFTGLTANGKKIFEGDIVTGLFSFGMEVKAVVAFQDGAFGLRWSRGGAEQFSAFTSICNIEYEVVGNIHDNPELLEEVSEYGK